MVREEIYLTIIFLLIIVVILLIFCNVKNELNIKTLTNNNKKNKII